MKEHYVTKYAQDNSGDWFSVTLISSGDGNADADRFAAILGHSDYQYWAPDGFEPFNA